MKIELRTVKVRDLIADYKDAQEKGVTAWGGLLDVRPAYQREFIYKDKQRDAVIDTLSKGFPLNTMYWVKANDGSGRYEVLDGQQRAICISSSLAFFSSTSATSSRRACRSTPTACPTRSGRRCLTTS